MRRIIAEISNSSVNCYSPHISTQAILKDSVGQLGRADFSIMIKPVFLHIVFRKWMMVNVVKVALFRKFVEHRVEFGTVPFIDAISQMIRVSTSSINLNLSRRLTGLVKYTYASG